MITDCTETAHCWHTTGATILTAEREVPLSDVQINQVCCWCGTIRFTTVAGAEGQHGPHKPEFLVSIGSTT